MDAAAIFNLEDALARVDDDRAFFLTLAEMFLDQAPHNLADIQAALAAGDAGAVARAAHFLKGAVLQFSSPALYEPLKELEALGRAGSLESAGAVYGRVESGLRQLLGILQALLAEGERT